MVQKIEDVRAIIERMKTEGLFVEWPESPKCDWVVLDEVGELYCCHPRNSPVYMTHLGRRAGICCVGSCPVSAFFRHQNATFTLAGGF